MENRTAAPTQPTGPPPDAQDYAEIDPLAKCDRFDGSVCTGIVFYNGK